MKEEKMSWFKKNEDYVWKIGNTNNPEEDEEDGNVNPYVPKGMIFLHYDENGQPIFESAIPELDQKNYDDPSVKKKKFWW